MVRIWKSYSEALIHLEAVLVQERGFLVLTGMPRPVLGESCTTSIKDFAIFPPHQKKIYILCFYRDICYIIFSI